MGNVDKRKAELLIESSYLFRNHQTHIGFVKRLSVSDKYNHNFFVAICSI